MQMSSSSTRRKTFELPKDEGLAEWTSKIKAMQRQVDADEEAEQKRLEQEIAASRLARQRRSRGVGYGGQTSDLDQLSKTDYSTSRHPEVVESNSDDPTHLPDRRKRQDEALNKLSGTRGTGSFPALPSGPVSQGKSPVAPSMQSKSISLPMEKSPEPMSLAAFMGGRATGPRLNKHAPQQDAHDPTKFEQRTHITAPHPVFGRGGVAMPGMAARTRARASADLPTDRLPDRVEKPSLNRFSSTERVTVPNSPQDTERFRATPEAIPPSLPSGRRERTMSTPNRSSPTQQSPPQSWLQEDRNARDGFRRPVSQSSLPASIPRAAEVPPNTPELRSRASEGRLGQAEFRPKTPESPYKTPDSRSRAADTQRSPVYGFGHSPSPPIAPLFSTPRIISSSTSPPPRKSPVTSHSLARPIQPDARSSSYGPSIPASQNPSPAFLRPPPSKDPTPSLSRLQGRGFVQNMVKVSSQMENLAAGPAGSPTSSEKVRPASAKRPAVLDRWPALSPNQNTKSPSISPKSASSPSPNTRPITSSLPSPILPSPSKKEPVADRISMASSSLPSIKQTETTIQPISDLNEKKSTGFTASMPPEGSPGLGSSSTLISYIKPLKTGDDPLVLPEATPSLEVDELGARTTTSAAKGGYPPMKAAAVWERSSPSRKPLSHPTKDRVRKPRKAKDGKGNIDESLEQEVVSSELDSVPDLSEHRYERPSLPSAPPVSAPVASEIPKEHEEPPSSHIDEGLVKADLVKDRWADQTIISFKPVSSSRVDIPPTLEQKPARNAMVGRRALPGLASTVTRSEESDGLAARQSLPPFQSFPSNQFKHLSKPESNNTAASSVIESPLDVGVKSGSGESKADHLTSIPLMDSISLAISTPSNAKEDLPQVITARHTRTPSTGNRATAMDVAQALNGLPSPSSLGWIEHRVEPSWDETPSNANGSKVEEVPKSPVVNRRNNISPALQAEKRKSNYEKYSAIMLPPLKEEVTPDASPFGSLTRDAVPPTLEVEVSQEINAKELGRKLEQVPNIVPTTPPVVSQENGDMVYFNHVNDPLPVVDIGALAKSSLDLQRVDVDSMTVSVEVMVITSSTAIPLKRDTAIFYDSEVLSIIHRSKSKSTGLVATTVFGWWGRRRHVNEKEQRKLQDLAKRYGTVLETVIQCSEPLELLKVLGGQLAIRQGTRAHWSSENTAMHLVRQSHGMILIDEHDLNIKNLCSGFSYCISILQTIYVWYGRGSTAQERQAALAYARGIAPNDASVIQLTEGESDNDEMFWMILGDDEYAKADYWQWRPPATEVDPRIWRIEIERGNAVISPVLSLSREVDFQMSVYVLDCVWEFFVLVAKDARGRRQEIQLAVTIATKLSTHVDEYRPYRPTVHILVLPSQIPLEFRLNFRDVDEALFNDGAVPEHMNLLSSNDALQHLQRNSWRRDALKDDTMLPLGLHTSDL